MEHEKGEFLLLVTGPKKVESHQELPADKTSSAAILSSHVGAKECPYHEEGPFEPTATEEKSYSSLSSTTVESDFGLALKIDTNDKLVKETSQKTKGRQDSMDFKESILKTPDPQCQRHSLQEPTQYTEKPPKKLSYSFQESIDQTFELVTTLDKKQSRNESTQGQRSIMCNRPKCTKVMPEVEAQAKFRMCPNCYTYYCSKHCRKAHWDRHQDQCPYTKISNMCQQILIKVRQDPISRRNFSVCARRGYLSRGRGAVKLVFYNIDDAIGFICKGWDSIRGQNTYIPRGDIIPQGMGTDTYAHIRSLCDRYNPGKKFVLLAAVRVTQEMSSGAGALVERDIIMRGTKLRLTPPQPEDDLQTVILTIAKGPGSDLTERHQECEAMKRHLQERGINLAAEFPDIYAKIKHFVEGGEAFVPFNVFLTDRRTTKMFMCIILPWADAEIFHNISAKETVTKSRRLWML
ncbi:apical junction component 1 homolog [Tachypleus tridentatus]|uniref:apical junction component 1 homolog n=1 Tax=Tachypleus tridentatus TaxID=6853 RepID=UPI003FD540FB